MAPFLSRLINFQKRFSANIHLDEPLNEQKRENPPEFEGSKQVRVLLFRELNGQERRLLFDSKCVRKRDPPTECANHRHHHESSIEKSFKLNDSKDFVYEFQKSSPDEQMLREMIFGSVSISHQSTTLKVHTIRSPVPQILMSVVFAAPPIPLFRVGEQEEEEGEEVRGGKDSHLGYSVPVSVPKRSSGHYEGTLQSHDGCSSLPTLQVTPGQQGSSLPRSSSYNSLQRRLLRNKATSIELGLSTQDCPQSSGQKRVKLGLSVLISLNTDRSQELSRFVFSHISLVEGHLMVLRQTVVKAYLQRNHFLRYMIQGSERFQQAIQDLYTAPRLKNPEWLTLISSSPSPSNHRSFLSKFAQLLTEFDKKETHFFVSTLLSAVLAHHLSWIPSVVPTDSKVRCSGHAHKHTPGWVDLLAKSRPYNPHWVQLGDLYGALGSSPKLSKTVVRGRDRSVVSKFLSVLSYFVRCSDVCERLYQIDCQRFLDTVEDTCKEKTLIENSQAASLRNRDFSCLCCRHTNAPKAALDTDSVSDDSSKDACDISITPPSECIQMTGGDNEGPRDNSQGLSAVADGCMKLPHCSCSTVSCDGAVVSEAAEEGYHSMEENRPHRLSEMLNEEWHLPGLEEIPLVELQSSTSSVRAECFTSFGWSLMADVTTRFMPDFCLQGVTDTIDEEDIREDLVRSTSINVLGEQVSEAVCILADIDTWSVQLLSSKCAVGVRVVMSSLVGQMCDAILSMCQLNVPPESCIIHLEDRMQELYFRSQMLSDYLLQGALSPSVLNVDSSDLPLLLNIAHNTRR